MSNSNIESLAQQGGEFHPRVHPSEPLTTSGHKPGVKVGNDAYSEFSAEIHPAGTAPKENTFQPNPQNEIPAQGADPLDFPGATSADVHTGMGHPGAGQTSQELHGGGRKKERSGLEGVGASSTDPIREQRADVSVPKDSRGVTGNASNVLGAEDRNSASAAEVAAERS